MSFLTSIFGSTGTDPVASESSEAVTETSESTIRAPPKASKRKTKKVKRKLPSVSTRVSRAGRGKAGANVYSEKTPEIVTSANEFDQNPPEQILDLCLIMDCTGSMGSWIAHCKNTLGDVIDDTIANDPNCHVRVAFVGYRDFCDQRLFAIHDFSYNAGEVKKYIHSQSATGGGDAPEDVQGGLRQALDLNWSGKEDSVKLAYLVADAPCHGSQYHSQSDDYPQGNPAGLVLEDLVREFSDREILLTCYKLTDSTDNMYDMMQQSYNQGAEEGGMEFIDIKGQVSQARSTGVSLHSAEMADCYRSGMLSSKSAQISKQRCRKRGW